MTMNKTPGFLLSWACILVREELAIKILNKKMTDINKSYKENIAGFSPHGDLAP